MKRLGIFSALIIVVASAAGMVLASMAQGTVSREITIVAKDMVFFNQSTESYSEANPTITVKRGQKVLIILRNDDAGMLHDLIIEGLDFSLETVSFSETTRLTFTAPTQPGEYVYLCSYHPRRMRGLFIVE